jgi:hypothetical protein
MIEQALGLRRPVKPEPGRGTTAEGVENTVELAEGGEAAALVDLLDFQVGIEQQLLGILHPCHLYVVDQRKTRDFLELVGKIAGADEKLTAQLVQGKFLLVVGVYITGDGIHLLGD